MSRSKTKIFCQRCSKHNDQTHSKTIQFLCFRGWCLCEDCARKVKQAVEEMDELLDK